ncbi:MotA/TolQ/ExbB proton channel family protein [Sneathiella sp.]|uniref:MotA/TolQ/ExbB proton channel family protein n=1 Tax=Sneathiella sp. TaxID=1964365 RepID=UPI0026224B7B|nr:MotA/TolQ/ExbB proton channel family protein [Sneathiella sp.]MDF2368032.1 MotA/TolQ/ExbB proton channel family protein [Sneathiella sp.]
MFDYILSLLEKGGPVVAILLFLSVISLATALYKGWIFLRLGIGRHEPARQALALWRIKQGPEPIGILSHRRGPLPQALIHAMRGMLYHPDKGTLIREDIDRVASREIARARFGIRIMETVGQVAPLLGLFGTVLGMIDAFQALQSAGATVDPSILAGGIWVALLTTAVGLAIAIPSSLLAAWFDSLIERETQTIEDMVTSVLTGEITSGSEKPALWNAKATTAG